jgi:hypothetical protein
MPCIGEALWAPQSGSLVLVESNVMSFSPRFLTTSLSSKVWNYSSKASSCEDC